MNNIMIDYDDFHDRLHKVLNEKKYHDESPACSGLSFDRGATTMFYEACTLLLQMDTERMRKEMEASA